MTLTYGNIRFQSFDKVIVQISIEKKDVQTSEMKLRLVHPLVGSSVFFLLIILSRFSTILLYNKVRPNEDKINDILHYL